MSEATRLISAIDKGDPHAAGQLLPLVYDELRKLAAHRLEREKPGQTLQATALVHEAYLRLVGAAEAQQQWRGRGHFFGAAAEAMRRILVESARRRESLKRGGDRQRLELGAVEPAIAIAAPDEDVLALHQALEKLETQHPRKAQLVKLRFFVGLTNEQAAEVLGVSTSTADNDWIYARSWLGVEISGNPPRV